MDRGSSEDLEYRNRRPSQCRLGMGNILSMADCARPFSASTREIFEWKQGDGRRLACRELGLDSVKHPLSMGSVKKHLEEDGLARSVRRRPFWR
jgi:hypothetical protein